MNNSFPVYLFPLENKNNKSWKQIKIMLDHMTKTTSSDCFDFLFYSHHIMDKAAAKL